jgi:CRP-like cAMP-binding protein
MIRPDLEASKNRLLRALGPETRQTMQGMLERVRLEQRQILHDYDKPIEFVYFPENCVGSMVGVLADGSAVETATIGNEGVVGIMLFLGNDRMAAQAFCQVAGDALRMTASDFRGTFGLPGMHTILGRYTQALLTQVAQASACNRSHAMTQRCARWLLQSHDRVEQDEFGLTQDFLAQMLGVRRATVTEAAGALQDAGAIRYKYGKIAIVDRAKLEALSCECYQIVAREQARLIEGDTQPAPLRDVRMSDGGQSMLTPPRREPPSK